MTTITRLSLADAAAAHLEARIANGEWSVGQRLPAEPELMTQLGVGRSTVREAVRTLARVGLVQVRQGDGTYVTSRPADNESLRMRCQRAELHEIYDVREALELQAARLAAERRSEDDVAALRELLVARASAVAARNARAFADADVGFHLRIVLATQNVMLIELYKVLCDSLYQSLLVHKQESEFTGVDTGPEHETLLAAIAERDAEAAVRAVTTLFRRGRYVESTIAPTASAMAAESLGAAL
jgi:GntR family transcriptional regulator, transcriptional repressor for pyruvate dehydrogenase complex